MKANSRKTLWAGLLAGLAMWVAAAPAQAVLVHGTLDPTYGNGFTGLGWRASFDLSVSDNCITAAGLGIVNLDYTTFGTTGDCNTSKFENVTLDFYNIGSPATTLESLSLADFAASSTTNVSLDQTQELIGIDLNNGQITGFDSSASFWLTPTDPLAGGGAYDFALVISSDPTVANLYYRPHGSEQSVADAASQAQFSATQPVVTFAVVPEPASLALVGIALAGLGLSRRRQR